MPNPLDLVIRSAGAVEGARIYSAATGTVIFDTRRMADEVDRGADSFRKSRLGLSTLASFAGGAAVIAVSRLARAVQQLNSEFVESSSAQEEVDSKFEAVFKESAPEAIQRLIDLENRTGRSADRMKEFASRVQDLLVPMGLARSEAAQYSTALTELALDLASFNDEAADEAIRRIAGGLIGEAEPLRRYGVILNETNVQQEAVNLGIARQGEELTDLEKVHARISLIFKGTRDAQGDLERTSESYTNTMRRLEDQLHDVRVELGRDLQRSILDMIQNMGGVEGVAEKAGIALTAVARASGAAIKIMAAGAPIVETFADLINRLTDDSDDINLRRLDLFQERLDAIAVRAAQNPFERVELFPDATEFDGEIFDLETQLQFLKTELIDVQSSFGRQQREVEQGFERFANRIRAQASFVSEETRRALALDPSLVGVQIPQALDVDVFLARFGVPPEETLADRIDRILAQIAGVSGEANAGAGALSAFRKEQIALQEDLARTTSDEIDLIRAANELYDDRLQKLERDRAITADEADALRALRTEVAQLEQQELTTSAQREYLDFLGQRLDLEDEVLRREEELQGVQGGSERQLINLSRQYDLYIKNLRLSGELTADQAQEVRVLLDRMLALEEQFQRNEEFVRRHGAALETGRQAVAAIGAAAGDSAAEYRDFGDSIADSSRRIYANIVDTATQALILKAAFSLLSGEDGIVPTSVFNQFFGTSFTSSPSTTGTTTGGGTSGFSQGNGFFRGAQGLFVGRGGVPEGLIEQRTRFPIGSGIGEVGERAPEVGANSTDGAGAVFPLKKLPSGRYGIEGTGGGGVSIGSVQIVLPGVRSMNDFRRAQSQVARELSTTFGSLRSREKI